MAEQLALVCRRACVFFLPCMYRRLDGVLPFCLSDFVACPMLRYFCLTGYDVRYFATHRAFVDLGCMCRACVVSFAVCVYGFLFPCIRFVFAMHACYIVMYARSSPVLMCSVFFTCMHVALAPCMMCVILCLVSSYLFAPWLQVSL